MEEKPKRNTKPQATTSLLKLEGKRKTLIAVLAAISISFAFITFFFLMGKLSFSLYGDSIIVFLNKLPSPLAIIPVVFMFLTAFILILGGALEALRKRRRLLSTFEGEREDNKVGSKNHIIFNTTNRISHEDLSRLKENLYEKIKEEASIDFLNKIKDQIRKSETYTDIDVIFSEAIERLQERANKTNTYSILNLTIGIFISSIAICMLGYSVFIMPLDTNTSPELALASRVGVSIGVQLLSLFFLKLYKSNLSEIKYIQNEITNIESRKIASLMSTDFSEENKMKIIEALASTERNFILEKGKTTVQLEQFKIDNENDRNYISVLEGLISRKEK